MSKFLKITVVAAAAMAATSAHALLRFADSSTFGNSSVAFVAVDTNASISLSVDLGVQMASFLNQAGYTNSAGSLSAGATALTAQWNFNTNTFTVNGAAVTVPGTANNWTTATSSFFSNGSVTGGQYQWGVIAADGVGNALTPESATNVVRSQNILYTVSGTQDFDVSNQTGTNNGSVANAVGRIENLYAVSNGTGTQTAGNFGANTATGGGAFLPTTLTASGVGDFGVVFGTNNFLLNPTEIGRFGWSSLGQPASNMFQIGVVNGVGTLAQQAATWSFNDTTRVLTYQVAAIPEPGTYAMLLAGLAAVGFAARRRIDPR